MVRALVKHFTFYAATSAAAFAAFPAARFSLEVARNPQRVSNVRTASFRRKSRQMCAHFFPLKKSPSSSSMACAPLSCHSCATRPARNAFGIGMRVEIGQVFQPRAAVSSSGFKPAASILSSSTPSSPLNSRPAAASASEGQTLITITLARRAGGVSGCPSPSGRQGWGSRPGRRLHPHGGVSVPVRPCPHATGVCGVCSVFRLPSRSEAGQTCSAVFRLPETLFCGVSRRISARRSNHPGWPNASCRWTYRLFSIFSP